jgi:hypothetical protein
MNILSHPASFNVQATRRKRAKPKNPRQKKQKCQKSSARGNFKTAPKQE